MVRNARILIGLSICLASCGDPVGPPIVTSRAFQVRASLSTHVISLSSPSDSIVITIRVRNNLGTRATIRQPMPDYDTHVWWTLSIVRDAWYGETGYSIEVNGNGELTLEPGQEVTRRIVRRANDLTMFEPATYRVSAGILWHEVAVGQLTIEP